MTFFGKLYLILSKSSKQLSMEEIIKLKKIQEMLLSNIQV